jgi:1-acyl-sn-glycerol-3-phosphate acyltransferase
MNNERFDAFGFDAATVDRTFDFFENYYSFWHRVEATGLENIPAQGGAILYSNHAGFNLLDGLMLGVAIRKHSPAKRFLRALYHVGSEKIPLFGYFLNNQLGATLGHPKNLQYLLEKGDLVLTYPEGGNSTSKPYAKRRELCPIDQFGDGFIRLALQHDVPLIPVAVTGCEEAIPTLFMSEFFGKAFKFDKNLYPISPQSALTALPSLFGFPSHCFNFLIGFPSKIKIKIGEPLMLPSQSAPHDVSKLKHQMYDTLQDMIYQLEAAKA